MKTNQSKRPKSEKRIDLERAAIRPTASPKEKTLATSAMKKASFFSGPKTGKVVLLLVALGLLASMFKPV